MNKGFVLATGLLAGTIIGAGIFSLPHVFSRLGILTGLFYLLVFGAVYFTVHLMYVRVLEASPGEHQFFYLAQKYFKKPWGSIASFVILSELVLVLTVYLILAPEFIRLITPLNFNAALIVFWFLGSLFIFSKLEFLGWAEWADTVGVLVIFFLILFASGEPPPPIEDARPLNLTLFLLPFGPLLFSLAGRPAIHKVLEEHRASKLSGRGFSLGWAIFWGTAIPVAIYFLFVLGVLRLNPNIPPDTISGLTFLSPMLLGAIGVLGLITLWTSYLMISINVKDILRLDLGWKNGSAALFVILAPLALYFAGLQNFLRAVSLTGGIFLALEAVFILAMWRKAFPNRSWGWVRFPLYALFAVAMGYEIINFLRR